MHRVLLEAFRQNFSQADKLATPQRQAKVIISQYGSQLETKPSFQSVSLFSLLTYGLALTTLPDSFSRAACCKSWKGQVSTLKTLSTCTPCSPKPQILSDQITWRQPNQTLS